MTGSWFDREGRPVAVPEPPSAASPYEELGDFQGAAYDRNAFTYGTEQEAEALWKILGLCAGERIVDVGCGTGRHLAALATRGLETVGVDLSMALLQAARRRGGRWVQAEATRLPLRDGVADAVLCVCQGGFGISPHGDRAVLRELVRIMRPGGRLALTAFSLAFAARHLAPADAIDVRRGVVHATAEVRRGDGTERSFPLWTTCYSAAHLEDIATGAGLRVIHVAGVEPGAYGLAAPGPDDPELLVVAHKPEH